MKPLVDQPRAVNTSTARWLGVYQGALQYALHDMDTRTLFPSNVWDRITHETSL